MTLQRQSIIRDFTVRRTGYKEFVVDLFCGAGGTSTGAHLASKDITVTACVNHDAKAIESHRLNHPNTKHFVEDIKNPEVIFFLRLRANALRKLYPGCIITVWASLECTNFSKAKGGQPRDADSRTLADFLVENNVYFLWKNGHKRPKKVTREEYMSREVAGFCIPGAGYVPALNPDYLMIENVVEFMSWGPLDENGKPISKKEGSDYIRWVLRVQSLGYRFACRELNSANFGAYTSRNRYFAQFAKGGLPISWPQPTHAKKPTVGDLFGTALQKWKAVKEVLDLSKDGVSIFNRKKSLVEATLKRIYAGLLKFIANGDESFLLKYFSGDPKNLVSSTEYPAATVRTKDGQALLKCDFLMKYNSTSKKGKYVPPSIDDPCPVVPAQSRLGKVSATFLQGYYGKGNSHSISEPCPTASTKDRFGLVKADFLVDYQYNSGAKSVEDPAPTLVTKDKFSKVGLHFIDQQYGQSKPSSVDSPLGAITNNPKYALVDVESWIMSTSFDNKGRSINEPAPTVLAGRKHHYLINPQYGNKGSSINSPSPVIIARQDKAPLGLITCEIGEGFMIPIYDDDSETMIKIKIFMAHYGIVDIKMRMLFVSELLQIQGFPKNYKLVGTQTDQKKFIGNAVEVNTARALFSSHSEALKDYLTRVEA